MTSPLAQILYVVFMCGWLYYCVRVIVSISNTLDRVEIPAKIVIDKGNVNGFFVTIEPLICNPPLPLSVRRNKTGRRFYDRE